jgi:hypothetical protein
LVSPPFDQNSSNSFENYLKKLKISLFRWTRPIFLSFFPGSAHARPPLFPPRMHCCVTRSAPASTAPVPVSPDPPPTYASTWRTPSWAHVPFPFSLLCLNTRMQLVLCRLPSHLLSLVHAKTTEQCTMTPPSPRALLLVRSRRWLAPHVTRIGRSFATIFPLSGES